MLLIVRRERRCLRRYVHLGTGNYHEATARAYTDWGLLTDDPEFGEDVHDIFQQLSGLGQAVDLRRLVQSPFGMREFLLQAIDREAAHAAAGQPSGIDARMNALTEPGVIQALYRASRAGVPIRLLVRGICCLRPGVPGLSETIRVRSLVGRFLEHSRVYRFANAGQPETWLASADWMERNLFQRVETAFPVSDPELARRVHRESIEWPFRDNHQAWDLDGQGVYHRATRRRGEPAVIAQEQLLPEVGPTEA